VAAFVRDHYALRYAISAPARRRHGEQGTSCTVVNIAKGGCHLVADTPAGGEGSVEGQISTLAMILPGAGAGDTSLRA